MNNLPTTIKKHKKLVLFLAHKYNYNNNLNDLIQQGNLGLIKAYNKYNPTKGAKFSTYAYYWIRQHIQRYNQANQKIKTLSLNNQIHNSNKTFLDNITQPQIQQTTQSKQLKTLTNKESRIIKHIHGHTTSKQSLTSQLLQLKQSSLKTA